MSGVASFDEIIIGNRIIFSDNTTQDTSSAAILSKCSNFERNPFTLTTQLISDNFVVNASLAVQNNLSSHSFLTSQLALLNDLDEFGIPRVQTRSFTEEIRNRIELMKDQLNILIPDILDPVNKIINFQNDISQILVSLPENSFTLSSFFGPTNQITSGDITIHDFNYVAFSQWTADSFVIKINGDNNPTTTIFPTQMIISQDDEQSILNSSSLSFPINGSVGVSYEAEEILFS